MQITVRAYQPSDLPDMIRIWNEVVEDGVAFPQENLLDPQTGAEFFSKQTYSAVAEADGQVLGLYILHPNNEGRCGHICNASYAVERTARGLHLGEALVSDCLAQGKAHGFGILQFNAVVATNKGYGNAVTTSRDVTDRAYACQVLLSLCETVGMRLRRDGQAGSCVTIQLRTSEFETWSHQMRLASATNVTGELYQAACALLDQAWDRKTPLRQLGVSVTQLADGTLRQYSLFDAADYARQEKLDTAVDALREKFGEGALFRAALLHSDERMAGGLHKKRRTGITKPIEDEAARIRKKYGNKD